MACSQVSIAHILPMMLTYVAALFLLLSCTLRPPRQIEGQGLVSLAQCQCDQATRVCGMTLRVHNPKHFVRGILVGVPKAKVHSLICSIESWLLAGRSRPFLS